MLPDVLLNKGAHRHTYLLIRITSLLAHKKLSMKNILHVKKKEISKLISRWEVGIEYISSQLTFTDTVSSLKKLEGCVFSFNLLHILASFMDYLLKIALLETPKRSK